MGIGSPRAAGESAGNVALGSKGVPVKEAGGWSRRAMLEREASLAGSLGWFGHTCLVPGSEQVVAVANFHRRVHRIRKSRSSGSAARRDRLPKQRHFQSRSSVSDRCGRPDRVVPSGRADWSGPGREGVGCGSAAPLPSSFDSREIRSVGS